MASQPGQVARVFLTKGVPSAEWRRAREVAVSLESCDEIAAAQLFIVVADAASEAGETVEAVRLARNAMLLHAGTTFT
jgi:hypothetical protein